MEQYSNNAEQLKNELRLMKNRYYVIDSSQKCDVCLKNIFSQEFYLFPCLHCFHKECLTKKFGEFPLETRGFERLLQIQQQIQSIYDKYEQLQKQKDNEKSFLKNIWLFTKFDYNENPQQVVISQDDLNMLKKYRNEFDNIVGKECIYCGINQINLIFQPFEVNESEKRSWDL